LDRLSYSPVVAFRGARRYVHSTTLYEQLIEGARSLGLQLSGPLEMRLTRLMTKQPQFLFQEGLAFENGEQPAAVSFYVGEVPWRCRISERDEPVERRESYNEAPIRERAVVEGQTIRMDGSVGARPFEVVTSLTLQLHEALFSIPPDRKWFLARIQLNRILLAEDAERMQITMIRKSGAGLTRCVISSGAASIGNLDFMLGNLA
jgi:hypothetical protein